VFAAAEAAQQSHVSERPGSTDGAFHPFPIDAARAAWAMT
jgi:hypothetical protein